jgi:hypothetical protein
MWAALKSRTVRRARRSSRHIVLVDRGRYERDMPVAELGDRDAC